MQDIMEATFRNKSDLESGRTAFPEAESVGDIKDTMLKREAFRHFNKGDAPKFSIEALFSVIQDSLAQVRELTNLPLYALVRIQKSFEGMEEGLYMYDDGSLRRVGNKAEGSIYQQAEMHFASAVVSLAGAKSDWQYPVSYRKFLQLSGFFVQTIWLLLTAQGVKATAFNGILPSELDAMMGTRAHDILPGLAIAVE